MPVQYQPYKSMFVSQFSPEIAGILKERYTKNFAMQDEVAQHLASLQTADFEGDMAAKKKLEQDIQDRLQSFSQRGDYENMTMDIARTASDYQSKATPLMQNYQLYSADREEKQKLLDAGRITQFDYEGWVKEAKRKYDPTVGDYVDYTGVEFDENGRVKSGSFYAPRGIAQFVDVQGEILEQLNSLKEIKEGGRTVKAYDTIDGVEYAITEQNQIKEYVPQELVRQVTENVLNRPDVKSYMAQQARYGVIDLDDESMTQTLLSYSSKMQNGSNQDREISTKLQQIAQQGTPGQKRKALEQAMYSSDYGRYFSMGMNARRPSVYGGALEIEYSQAYIARLKDEGTSVANSDVVLTRGVSQAVNSPLGDATHTGASEQTLATAENKAFANSSTAVELFVKQSGLQDILPPVPNLVDRFAKMDAAGAYKFAKEYGVDAQLVQRTMVEVQRQRIVSDAAREAREVAAAQAGYTPSAILQRAREEKGLRFDQLQGITTNEQRLELARDLSRNSTQRFQSPEPIGGGIYNLIRSGLPDIPGLSGSSTSQESITDRNVTLGLITEVIMQTGVGRAEAEKLAIQGMATKSEEGRFPMTSNVGGDMMNIFREVISESGQKYNEALRQATSGFVSLPEIHPTEGDAKKIMGQLNEIFKDKGATEFSAAATNTGESVEGILGGPDKAGNYRVSNMTLAKAVTSSGGVETMYRVTFKPEDGPSISTFIPADNMVAYLPPDAAQTMYQISNTPADRILDQAMQKIIHAPGVAAQRGATVVTRSNGYSLNFRFVPIIAGDNNAVQGFQAIEMTGTGPRGPINHTFQNEEDFYRNYNNFQLTQAQ